MVNALLTSNLISFYSYLTKSQRTLIIIVVLLIIPVLGFSSYNVIHDGDSIYDQVVEVEIVDIFESTKYTGYETISWTVRHDFNGISKEYIFIIGNSLFTQVKSYSIADLVMIKLENYMGGYLNINGKNLPSYYVLEVKGGLLWDYQNTILEIFFVISIFLVTPVRRGLDRKLEIEIWIPRDQGLVLYTETSSLTHTTCEKCGLEYQSGQKYCENCGSSLIRCIICYQKPMGHQRVSLLKCCESYAHTDHILNWLKIKQQCPNCKKNYSANNLRYNLWLNH